MKLIFKNQWLVWLAIAFLFFMLIGCKFIDRYLNDETVDEISSESIETGKFSTVDGIACIPDITSYEIATLVDVIDGDSIKVTIDGKQFQVRYIGIDTPEYYSDQRVSAIEATHENEELLAGDIIYLFKDQSNTDIYNRLLRFVIANDKFVNLELVKTGHARSKWYKPDTSCQPTFDLAALQN